MKKVLITILIACVFSNLALTDYSVQNVYGGTNEKKATTSKKQINVKVLSVTKKELKLKITNTGNKTFFYSELFALKKRVKNKWKKIQFKDNVFFAKTRTVRGKSSVIVKINWKKYFDKNLPKGKYKIKFVKAKTFKIK